MSSPFLSIITVNFNNLVGLKATVHSVLSQCFTDLEYVIIDGASTDGSLKFLNALDPTSVKWISEADSGIYNAMNKGIAMAKGHYILFLNSGDVLNGPEALRDFVKHEHFAGDIIYGDYKFEKGFKKYPDTLYPAYFMKTSLPHQSTLFKRNLFDEMGLYNESYRMAADRAFYLKCYLSQRYRFQHVPYFLTIFDLSGFSNDSKESALKQEEDSRILKELYGDDYERYKKELEEELERNRIPKYSWKGIMKRIKKRLSDRK